MTTASCEQVREAAAELALGAASGPERGAALEHLTGCDACQAYVAELAGLADRLLLAAPEREPPAGFDERVLERVAAGQGGPAAVPLRQERAEGRRRWQPRRARVLGAAAALALLGAAIGAGADQLAGGGSSGQASLAALGKALGATSFSAGHLTDAAGRSVGEVLVCRGHPSWVFVSVSAPSASSGAEVRLTAAGGSTTWAGYMTLDRGSGSWGGVVRIGAQPVRSVVVSTTTGTVLSARMGPVQTT
ncbi:MAG: anti-sigma factor family protein [Acidimicrobiales bacterium]